MVFGSNPDIPASGTKLSTESLQELRACTGSVFRSVDFHIAECVAVVARRPHKPKVAGSSPASATIYRLYHVVEFAQGSGIVISFCYRAMV